MDLAALFLVWLYGMMLGILFGPLIRHLMRWAIRPLRCRMGWCQGRISSTQYGIGWMCAQCGSLRHWESWKKVDEHLRR